MATTATERLKSSKRNGGAGSSKNNVKMTNDSHDFGPPKLVRRKRRKRRLITAPSRFRDEEAGKANKRRMSVLPARFRNDGDGDDEHRPAKPSLSSSSLGSLIKSKRGDSAKPTKARTEKRASGPSSKVKAEIIDEEEGSRRSLRKTTTEDKAEIPGGSSQGSGSSSNSFAGGGNNSTRCRKERPVPTVKKEEQTDRDRRTRPPKSQRKDDTEASARTTATGRAKRDKKERDDENADGESSDADGSEEAGGETVIDHLDGLQMALWKASKKLADGIHVLHSSLHQSSQRFIGEGRVSSKGRKTLTAQQEKAEEMIARAREELLELRAELRGMFQDTVVSEDTEATCAVCSSGRCDCDPDLNWDECFCSNKIVICDKCNCGFHQQCHEPQITEEAMGDEEDEWWCSRCDILDENNNEVLDAFVVEDGQRTELKVDLLLHGVDDDEEEAGEVEEDEEGVIEKDDGAITTVRARSRRKRGGGTEDGGKTKEKGRGKEETGKGKYKKKNKEENPNVSFNWDASDWEGDEEDGEYEPSVHSDDSNVKRRRRKGDSDDESGDDSEEGDEEDSEEEATTSKNNRRKRHGLSGSQPGASLRSKRARPDSSSNRRAAAAMKQEDGKFDWHGDEWEEDEDDGDYEPSDDSDDENACDDDTGDAEDGEGDEEAEFDSDIGSEIQQPSAPRKNQKRTKSKQMQPSKRKKGDDAPKKRQVKKPVQTVKNAAAIQEVDSDIGSEVEDVPVLRGGMKRSAANEEPTSQRRKSVNTERGGADGKRRSRKGSKQVSGASGVDNATVLDDADKRDVIEQSKPSSQRMARLNADANSNQPKAKAVKLKSSNDQHGDEKLARNKRMKRKREENGKRVSRRGNSAGEGGQALEDGQKKKNDDQGNGSRKPSQGGASKKKKAVVNGEVCARRSSTRSTRGQVQVDWSQFSSDDESDEDFNPPDGDDSSSSNSAASDAEDSG